MHLENSVTRIQIIKDIVKQFAQTDKEVKQMILDYYKSKDYLKKYLTADGADQNAEIST